MKLLYKDSSATDPLYNKIQEDHPDYEPPSLLRDRVEALYQTCQGLVDKKFPIQIKHDFASCYSELYFCSTFIKRLGLDVTHPSDKGPDYYLKGLDCWAEVVTAADGVKDNVNSIPQTINGVLIDAPRRQFMLRFTNSFTYKAHKILEYINKGLIHETQKIVICINGGWLSGLNGLPFHPVGGVPAAVSALLPIGNMILMIDKDNMSIAERTFEYRDYVIKEINGNSEQIRTDYFLDSKYSCISAVVYSYAKVTSSINDSDLGRDFFIIHNPMATNKLPLGSIKCGVEYNVQVDDESISVETIENERIDQ